MLYFLLSSFLIFISGICDWESLLLQINYTMHTGQRLNTLRPQLLIQTQFSSEEEVQTHSHLHFEAKDAISEASSYDLLLENQVDEVLNNRGYVYNMDSILAGTEQLTNIIDSWQINTLSQTFDILKSLKPVKLTSMSHGRTISKEIQLSKSLANFKH